MLTKSSLALFTSATTRPLGEREGSVVVCQRGWGGTKSSRQVAGQLPREGCWPGISYQPPRKELINEKRPRWGEASKESLQGVRLFWPQAVASLSRPFPPAPLWGAEPSMTHAGQGKGEWWDMSQTQGMRGLCMMCCRMRHGLGQEGPVTHGNGASTGKSPPEQQAGHRARCI